MIPRSKYFKAFTLSMICFVASIGYTCTRNTTDEIKNNKAPYQGNIDKSKYPNDDSELAWLMRSMYENTLRMRTDIMNDKKISSLKDEFILIHSAQPTDPKVKTEAFKSFSKQLIKNYDLLYQDPSESNFNILINDCIACHQTYCPGPIPKIKKLKILH